MINAKSSYQSTANHRSLANLLQNSQLLRDFVFKLQQLYQINQTVRYKLPPDLQPHCQVANLREGTLILTTTSPTWNHKLRFHRLELLSSLRADPAWAGLKAIELKVEYLPTVNTDVHISSNPAKSLSKAAAKALARTADTISNRRLAEALIKLSKR